jgi:hypothetical protein
MNEPIKAAHVIKNFTIPEPGMSSPHQPSTAPYWLATLAAPFPYFGGKSLACETVWAALGDPEN